MINDSKSLLTQLEQRILNSDRVNAALRHFFSRWMDLPRGPHAVTLTENLRVPMPDGIVLVADHYAPVDVERGPTVLIRTPYSRRGAGNLIAGLFAWQFAAQGYHVICQDVRGRFASEGEFVPFVSEAADGEATLAWIAQQPWSDGSIGMWGASYLGYVQWAAAASGSPHLKALAPMITSANLMHYPEHGFPLDLLTRWMFQMATMDDPSIPLWERMRRINNGPVQDQHLGRAFMHLPLHTADELAIGRISPLYREMAEADPHHPHWHETNHAATVAQGPPATFVSGWYDLFLDGLLTDFAAQQAAGLHPHLTIGPWHHLQGGYMPVAFEEALDWFAVHLKGLPAPPRDKPVRLFVMGAQEWRSFDAWPPPAAPVRFFLHGNGVAKTGRLRREPAPADHLPDHYRYDPADPTPNLGGPKMGSDAGAVDNRPLEARRDVLIFSTPPLAQAVTVAGPVQAELYVRSSLPYCDFFVRLCDVDRSGRSLNVCDGNLRIAPGRGEPQPDGSLRVVVAMSATAYSFEQGHRIRLQVSSGAHPRFARNLGVADQMTSTQMLPADQTVYHDADHPSAIVLPLVAL